MVCGANIRFENLIYPKTNLKSDNQPILKDISGCFYSGQLTGILGSSGAGKTTLISILSGHITTNIDGKISINGRICNEKTLKNSSTYLIDQDLLQTSLTVKESLMFVVELKLDKCVSKIDKEKIFINIINKLNLNNCLNTMTENLSGGEKRRLSIALELISDPPIIFMDEPTSGLDEVSAKQSVDLLRSLTRDGKTVICTIHQQSNIIFNMFEHVYFINDGKCIYDGLRENLVPFLSKTPFPCPEYYSPAEYIIELTHDNSELTNQLNEMIKSFWYQKDGCDMNPEGEIPILKKTNKISFINQTGILLKRNFLQTKRRKLAMSINVAHHLLCGLITGFLYFGTKTDAAKTENIYKLSLGAVAYVSFAYAIIPILSFPFQIKIIKREINNEWYDLKAYFLMQSLSPLPVMLPLCLLFTITCFGLVDSTLPIDRHFRLTLVLIFIALVSHFYGHAIGALFNPKNSCVIGSMIATIAINIGAFHHYQISLPTWLIRQTSFTRYGLVGCLLTFYQSRKLNCSEIYCRHSVEKLIYDDFGVGIPSYLLQITGLVLNVIFYASCFYFILIIKFHTNLIENLKNFKNKYIK